MLSREALYVNLLYSTGRQLRRTDVFYVVAVSLTLRSVSNRNIEKIMKGNNVLSLLVVLAGDLKVTTVITTWERGRFPT